MEPLLVALVALAVAAGILGVALLWALLVRAERKRQRELEPVARALGLEFVADGGEPDRVLRRFDAMRAGSGPRIRHEMRGAYKGHHVRCFDFQFTVQRGSERRTEERGVVLVRVPRAWPRLLVVPERLGHKLADALGAEDLDFESQEFSDRFWVQAEDRRFAYDVIHPRMIEFLMASGVQRWEVRDGWLCAWEVGRFSPRGAALALDRAIAFLERVPPRLWPRAAGRKAVP